MADPPYTATEPAEPGTKELRARDAHRHQSATLVPAVDEEHPEEVGLAQSGGKKGKGKGGDKDRDPLKDRLPGDVIELADGEVILVSSVSQDAYSVRYSKAEEAGGLSTYDLPLQYWESFVAGGKVLRAADALAQYTGKPERTTQFELDQHEFLREHETRRVAAARHVEPVFSPEHTPQSDSGRSQHSDQARADRTKGDHKTPDELPKDSMPEDAKSQDARFRAAGEKHKTPDEVPKDAMPEDAKSEQRTRDRAKEEGAEGKSTKTTAHEKGDEPKTPEHSKAPAKK